MKKEEQYKKDWKLLYKIGAIAAFIAVLIFRRNLSAEFTAFNGFGIFEVPKIIPVSAEQWLALLVENPLVGLVLLNLGDVINYLLVSLLFVALYIALCKTNHRVAVLALTLALCGSLIFISTNQAMSMFSLSRQYATADTVQRALLLEKGEALLAVDNPGTTNPGMGYLVGLLLVTLAGLMFSLVMLRSQIFNKITAWMGLLSNGFQIFYFFLLVIAPAWVALPFILSAPFRVTWYVMAAIRLLKMAKSD